MTYHVEQQQNKGRKPYILFQDLLSDKEAISYGGLIRLGIVGTR